MNWISFFICIFLTFSQITCSGIFELRLKSFRNDNGVNSLGRCCGDKQLPNGSCQSSCKTRFRICLKQYQAEIDINSPCTFGAAATQVIGDNSFNLTMSTTSSSTSTTTNRLLHQSQKGPSINPIGFPFEFTWPGPFTLIVEAYHDANDSVSTSTTTESLIARFPIQGELGVGSNWTQYTNRLSSSHNKEIEFEYRVTCAQNYYGPGCGTLCRERDDSFGHSACSASGEIICLSGWQGEYCTEPRCSVGCNLKNGHCQKPNECICKSGYKGPNCDVCELYPGCVHGTCTKRWECICKEGWGGIFCNQDLNFCTNHKPCHNGGTCSNTGPGSYTCKCMPGFDGTDCEIPVVDCSTNACQNGGTCVDQLGGGYKCQCAYGWIGRHCETQTVTCASKPCSHGGVCRDTSSGFKCECPAGYGGRNCELEVQNCNPNPCLNNGKCSAIRGNHYQCQCAKGFTGENCEENIDDCHINPCKNGGVCIDGINSYQCKCMSGYTGASCEKKIDFCLAKPCANGGNCRNVNNSFECICRGGFAGIDCSIDIDECQSAPCKNGATCINRLNSFECQCPEGFQGVNCDEPASTSRLLQASTTTYQEAQIRSRDEDLSGSQIALIAILSVAVPIIAICGIAVAICMKRKRKREQEKDDAEARKQNEQNASHITHLHQHHHNSIVAVKRASNSTIDNSSATHHMIKNTWDKSINNMTNSISMDDACMLNTSMYGTMSNFSDNASSSGGANTSSPHLDHASAYQSQLVTPDSLQRAKSQKQLNTDPTVNRASLIMHRQHPTTTKELALDKRISVLAESPAASCWSGNNNSNHHNNNNNNNNHHANASRSILDRC